MKRCAAWCRLDICSKIIFGKSQFHINTHDFNIFNVFNMWSELMCIYFIKMRSIHDDYALGDTSLHRVSIINHHHRVIIYQYCTPRVYHRCLWSAVWLFHKTHCQIPIVILPLLAMICSTHWWFMSLKYLKLNIDIDGRSLYKFAKCSIYT